jgi:hypothetical protein
MAAAACMTSLARHPPFQVNRSGFPVDSAIIGNGIIVPRQRKAPLRHQSTVDQSTPMCALHQQRRKGFAGRRLRRKGAGASGGRRAADRIARGEGWTEGMPWIAIMSKLSVCVASAHHFLLSPKKAREVWSGSDISGRLSRSESSFAVLLHGQRDRRVVSRPAERAVLRQPTKIHGRAHALMVRRVTSTSTEGVEIAPAACR